MISVYLLIRVGNSLKLFVFSLSLFFRFFYQNAGTKNRGIRTFQENIEE